MPKKKAEEKAPEVEGFTLLDYEGLDMYQCDRCRAGWTTFKAEDAEVHAKTHEGEEDLAQTRAEVEADLVNRAQVTTEGVEGGPEASDPGE